MTPEAFDRLEGKIDKLTEAVTRLVLVEERQMAQGQRIGDLEKRSAVLEVAGRETDKRLDKWINRGVGVWALAFAIFSMYTALKK